MIIVAESIEINRPTRQVFEFITDFEGNPQWQSGLLEVKSHGPAAAGQTVDSTSHYLGKKYSSRIEITEFEDGKSLTMKSTNGPIMFEVTWECQPVGHKTQFVSRNRLDVSSFYRLAEPVLEHIARTQVAADLQKLKAILESTDPV